LHIFIEIIHAKEVA